VIEVDSFIVNIVKVQRVVLVMNTKIVQSSIFGEN